jgi:diacylglycerol kinase family enzyme
MLTATESGYRSVEDAHWAQGPATLDRLVAVAGGDGTVADVMRCLAGSSVRMTILPLGTADNIAAFFGLTGRSEDELVAGWRLDAYRTTSLEP